MANLITGGRLLLLFVTIAFLSVFPIGELLAGQMIVKVALSALFVPPLVALFVRLGRRLDRTPAR